MSKDRKSVVKGNRESPGGRSSIKEQIQGMCRKGIKTMHEEYFDLKTGNLVDTGAG